MMLNDYTLPNKELRVSMSMAYASEDLGAQSSSTDTAHKGIKPKVLNISLVIPYEEEDSLSALIAVAESVEGDGSLTVYDITDRTANPVGVRQVKFTDNFTVREAGTTNAWNVSFSLQEHRSTPERVEERQEAGSPQEQTAEGVVVSDAGEQQDTAPLTSTERFLSKVDRALS